ncbi:MAG: hypothetical protein ACRCVT_15740 [Leadbetterella sp.]
MKAALNSLTLSNTLALKYGFPDVSDFKLKIETDFSSIFKLDE